MLLEEKNFIIKPSQWLKHKEKLEKVCNEVYTPSSWHISILSIKILDKKSLREKLLLNISDYKILILSK